MSPYRHPAPRPDLTARPWSVSEWQKVYVRLLQWVPGSLPNLRWLALQRRRAAAAHRVRLSRLAGFDTSSIQRVIDQLQRRGQ